MGKQLIKNIVKHGINMNATDDDQARTPRLHHKRHLKEAHVTRDICAFKFS